MEGILQRAIETGGGGVQIDNYPPSAYLTQLVFRALKHRRKLSDNLRKKVSAWAWTELAYQLALIHAKSKTADAFAVAYLLMLVTGATPLSETNPEQAQIQRAAVEVLFECQMPDGSWPLSRPLFHYEKFGNAYCYEYEMLTQLLQEEELQDLLIEHLGNLDSAVQALSQTVYKVQPGVRAWASGHHPQLKGPESWTTASVYHFAHMLDRLLAEAVRRELFRYLDTPLPLPPAAGTSEDKFAPKFLDSMVLVQGKPYSLRKYLWDNFVGPLSQETENIAQGHTFAKETPRSAIFFGPPGTSKTELSKEVASFLGWPQLSIDPSHLLRNGMDGIQAEANAIFRMLEETERVVVLFDEFDELVRERGSANAQPFSRLLTTAMLPKLANIHKRATVVFIIATNNISEFDLAIRRPGRFDRVLQIMPPTYDAKLTKKDWGPSHDVDFDAKLRQLTVKITDTIKKQLGDLTFSECDGFAAELVKASDNQEAVTALGDAWQRCTLKLLVSKEDETTWEQRCESDAQFNR
jgi:ATPase family associated with various cellular activities (AAA)